ncbi:MAG TPA: restriction endonuclease subunit S [Chiayiivirga sp.]|nr:restriction endonuclease subunit S [Chiayiivirga sp.]
MANEWPMVRLGDYVDSNLGKMLDAQKNKGVPRPYLGNSNVRWGSFDINDLALMKFEEGEEARYGIRDGDLIVCEGGEPGRCAVWREQVPDMKIQKALHRVRPRDGLNNYYLFYWFMLAGRAGWLEPFFTGTTIKHLTGKALNELKVPLPPIKEQRAIAHILGTLDDKIELNRKQNQTLEAMARALFKAWFVDFEPVRAKLEGRWQRGQSLPGLPAHLYDLFPDRLVESELGEIPEGWMLGSFADSVEIIGGGTPKTSVSEYWGGKIPWFSVVDTPAGSDVFVVKTEKSITRAGLEGSSARLISKGATIISARGTVGNLALAGCEMTFNQSCYALQGKNGSGSYFVFLSAQRMVEQLKAMAHGSVFSTITRQTFEAVRVVLPPEKVLQQFEKNAATLLDPILGHVKESRYLAQLRDTLLPKLISGDLRIPDAETFLTERGL